MLLVYTGQRRNAKTVLKHRADATSKCMNVLRDMRELADLMRHRLLEADFDGFAELLNHGWQLKGSIGLSIADQRIDASYEKSRQAGAQGGKLLGAGGGGFMLLMAPPECHQAIRDALDHPQEIEVHVDRLGSQIIFFNEHH